MKPLESIAVINCQTCHEHDTEAKGIELYGRVYIRGFGSSRTKAQLAIARQQALANRDAARTRAYDAVLGLIKQLDKTHISGASNQRERLEKEKEAKRANYVGILYSCTECTIGGCKNPMISENIKRRYSD